MEILRDFSNPPQGPIALTIGSFDGVHRGHQSILNQVKQAAQAIKGRSLVLSFEPHPRLVLKPQTDGHRLVLLQEVEEKATWLAHYGLDILALVPFTPDFARQSPQAYLEDFLLRCFNPQRIIIGYDHRFGANRLGDIHYLRAQAPKHGFEVEEIPAQRAEGLTISSSKIRQALQDGAFHQALNWLGHSYSLRGRVVRGQQLGRELGFPTANLEVLNPNKLIPPKGIYAARAFCHGAWRDGMLYLGSRPTLAGDLAPSIELHIFDFQADLYGSILQLEIYQFLRSDARFENLNALRQALANDELAARAVLAQQTPPPAMVQA